MIYNITIQENKTIKSDNDIILNQFENEIDELHFTFPFPDFGWVGVFKSPTNSKLEIPIVDNKIIIDNNITSLSGNWDLICVGKKEDVIFISNIITIKSNRNHLNLKNLQEQDINIKNLYLEIQETLTKLNDTGLNEINDLLSEINKIQDELNNLNVNVDLTDVTTKLQTIQGMQQSLIQMINGISNQILSGTNRLPNMEINLDENHTNIKDLQDKIGNDTDKIYGTLFHYCYWAMIRAEQAHSDTQKILTALNVTPTTIEEIEN